MEVVPFSPERIEVRSVVWSCLHTPAQLPMCTHKPTVPSRTIEYPNLERIHMDP